jgi:protein phosphatase
MANDLFLSFGSKSETGKGIEFNTDATIDFKILDGYVFAVCDGHNGEQGHGALASKLVVESIKKYFYNRSYKDMATALTNAVVFANRTLYEQSLKDTKYKNIATTLAILIQRGNNVYYAYAGDSRIYFLRDGNMQLLTRDHVDTPEDPKEQEVRILLGRNKDIKFGVCKTPLVVQEHDLFLLATDGLTDYVSKDELLEILKDPNTSPEHKSLQLAESVIETNGADNYSIQVIEFSKPVSVQIPATKKNLRPLLVGIATVLVSLLVVIAAFVYLPKLENKRKHKAAKLADIEQVQEAKPKKAVESKKKTVDNENKPIKTERKADKPVQNTPALKPAATKTKTGNQSLQGVYYEHQIQYGENLYRLGLRYNTTQQKLIDLNGAAAKNMIAGKKLKIPVKALHKVVPGDSFSSLSDKYQVKIKLIATANKMNSNQALSVGKILVIPNP